jgi:ribulose-phosphate 3-epimerase
MMEIIPTCVPRARDELAECARVARAFSPWIHVDIDDGAFTSARSWPYALNGTVEMFDLAALDGLKAEVHLMVEEPREIGLRFAGAGAARISGHVEGFADATGARAAIAAWRAMGVEVGLSILLDTPLAVAEPLIPSCDFLTVMSIATVGLQGAPYDDRARERVEELHAKYPNLVIEVDGGVSEVNVAALARAGAARFAVGSAIMKAEDPAGAYKTIHDTVQSAIQ